TRFSRGLSSVGCSSGLVPRGHPRSVEEVLVLLDPPSPGLGTLALRGDAVDRHLGLVRGDGPKMPDLSAELVHQIHVRIQTQVTGATNHELPLGLRSEEHTSELQSRENLVCRLLLE